MLRLLGVLLLIIGLILTITIVLAPIGIWVMLFGLLLALLGGSTRVIVRRERDRAPAATFFAKRRARREEAKKLELEAATKAPRADAADNFQDAVMLYQRFHGHQDTTSAIRVLATEALREKGFLR